MKSLLFGMIFLSFSSALFASGNCSGPWVDTKYMKVKVYQFAVSKSTDCSNPIVLFSNPVGREVDFLKSPTLGGGNIPDGVYPCLMITMSDQMKIAPTTSDGLACVAGVEYIKDVCRDDTTAPGGCGACTPDTTDLLIGTTFTNTACHGYVKNTTSSPYEDRATLFLTTKRDDGGSSWNKPTTVGVITPGDLTSPFIVNGSSVGTFVVNARNGICTSSVCSPENLSFGFR